MTQINEDIAFEILSVVAEIPYGQVATYGQIARLINRPKNSRLVGHILADSELYGEYPCHRVVNSQGRTAPYWFEQYALLAEEGVEFKSNGCVDLARFKWEA